MLDNRDGSYDALTVHQIQQLCDRKFGVGADGLIRINSKEGFDFEMDYFNADGTKSFCGNGARCSVRFAHALGQIGEHTTFYAIDGEHVASYQPNSEVALRMNDVPAVQTHGADWELNTGSPHYIRFVTDVDGTDVYALGRQIRHQQEYEPRGINVNFVAVKGENALFVRTYERGVEDETLSCGTGVTAAAIAYCMQENQSGTQEIAVETRGGKLTIRCNISESGASDVFLIGPAVPVFSGEIVLR